mmetsp:Transcript_107577/g.302884  ORF Transcript_107577/g.302884 Transcript_107577/m.302884 type:complete len:224 (-) Transcript_107577:276-947(-)
MRRLAELFCVVRAQLVFLVSLSGSHRIRKCSTEVRWPARQVAIRRNLQRVPHTSQRKIACPSFFVNYFFALPLLQHAALEHLQLHLGHNLVVQDLIRYAIEKLRRAVKLVVRCRVFVRRLFLRRVVLLRPVLRLLRLGTLHFLKPVNARLAFSKHFQRLRRGAAGFVILLLCCGNVQELLDPRLQPRSYFPRVHRLKRLDHRRDFAGAEKQCPAHLVHAPQEI